MSIDDDFESQMNDLRDSADQRVERAKKRATAIILLLAVIASCVAVLAITHLFSIFDLQKVGIIFATICGVIILEVTALVVNHLKGNPVSQQIVLAVVAVIGGAAFWVVFSWVAK